MEPSVQCNAVLEGNGHFTAACFHPQRPSIVLGCGDQIFEVDGMSGENLWCASASHGLGDIRLISFLEGKADILNLAIAFQHGDIQLWDSESLQVKDHITPHKKDEGHPAICWVCVNIGGEPFAFLSRGSTGLERIGLSSRRASKPIRADGKWRPTCISYSPRQMIVAGSDSGDLRFLDPKTLNIIHTFVPAIDTKHHFSSSNSIFRTAVVSLSFCPQQPHVLLSSFQGGGLALWNLNTSVLDTAVSTGSAKLIDAMFHPWIPAILTLTSRGEMSAWNFNTNPMTRRAELNPSQLFRPFNFMRLDHAYHCHVLPYLPAPSSARHSKLLFHSTHNIFTILNSPDPESHWAFSATEVSRKLIYRFVDTLCPYSLSPISSVCPCPTDLLEKDGTSSDLLGDFNEDKIYYIRRNRLISMNVSQSDSNPSTVAALPEVDSDGKLLRPLHLTYSHRCPLVAVAMLAVDHVASSSISQRSGCAPVAWKVALVDVALRESEGVDAEADDEQEGRELFFIGIGAPAKPQQSRLSSPPVDRSTTGATLADKWNVILDGRDAVFCGDRMILLLANGVDVSLFRLPESADSAHMASWQVKVVEYFHLHKISCSLWIHEFFYVSSTNLLLVLAARDGSAGPVARPCNNRLLNLACACPPNLSEVSGMLIFEAGG